MNVLETDYVLEEFANVQPAGLGMTVVLVFALTNVLVVVSACMESVVCAVQVLLARIVREPHVTRIVRLTENAMMGNVFVTRVSMASTVRRRNVRMIARRMVFAEMEPVLVSLVGNRRTAELQVTRRPSTVL